MAPEVVLIRHVRKCEHVAIDVSDNVTDIPNGIGTRVFVSLYTTHRDDSGVGLAISRQIMTAHHGTISFFDRPDGGKIF